jgi:hypothetical protein
MGCSTRSSGPHITNRASRALRNCTCISPRLNVEWPLLKPLDARRIFGSLKTVRLQPYAISFPKVAYIAFLGFRRLFSGHP